MKPWQPPRLEPATALHTFAVSRVKVSHPQVSLDSSNGINVSCFAWALSSAILGISRTWLVPKEKQYPMFWPFCGERWSTNQPWDFGIPSFWPPSWVFKTQLGQGSYLPFWILWRQRQREKTWHEKGTHGNSLTGNWNKWDRTIYPAHIKW